MSIEQRILAVGQQIPPLAIRLHNLGYTFQDYDEVFPGPEEGTEAAIERLEREVGVLPLAIKFFWRVVGSVNFMGEHPGWGGCDYPDPLIVYPPSAALEELEFYIPDRELRLKNDEPYIIPIAPDDYHKANVSGGMWYNLSVPAADDPPLNDERHEMTFVSYLEFTIGWGGFPGLDQCPKHNWPLAQIRGGPAGES